MEGKGAKFRVNAILFDMDGTLIDSTAGVQGAWEKFSEKYPFIDLKEILNSAHGVRTEDNLRKYCGVNDTEQLKAECILFEEAIVTTASENGRPGLLLLPGAMEILSKIRNNRFLPHPLWGICTSGTHVYASAALGATGLPIPDVFVTADDVSRGKPDPEPFLKGAQSCGVRPENCLVFEDSPNGVRSAKAAGCKVVGLLTTHPRLQMEEVEPDSIVSDLSRVSITPLSDSLEIELTTD